MTGFHFFKLLTEYKIQDLAEYRSWALHGHPLQNALIVSTMMSFILFSGLKEQIKVPLWIMGYIAILCFNTRSSIVGNALIFGCYLLYTIFKDRTVRIKTKRHLIVITIISLTGLVWLMNSYGLGGRLLNMGLFDDSSAQVRVDTWSLFNYFSIEDFIWGISHLQYQRLLYVCDLFATENFWIDWLLRLGVVFLVPFIVLYFIFVRSLYKGYSFVSKCFTAATFLLIASTNNSLSSTFVPTFVFVMSIFIFHPLVFDTVVPSKYLSQKAIQHKKQIVDHLNQS